MLAHDALDSGGRETGTDLNGEIVLRLLDAARDPERAAWLEDFLHPRLAVGADVNVSGYTSQFYAGANWHAELWRHLFRAGDALYTEFTGGFAVHDGALDAGKPRREALGSRVLFHLSGEIGYAFGAHYSLGAYYDHASNSGLARYNRSLDNVGLRLGYHF